MAGRQGEPMMGTDPSTWKWINLAEPGTFRGHPSGEFSLDGKVFDEIVRNFKADGLPIAFDLEHASEQDPTSGSIPTTGAPAQGWVHDLQNRGPAGLWGLVEWGEQAKDYIRTGKYKFCSPAVRLGSKDRVTGKPIGARLTSVAMTNNPFLKGLDMLAARDAGGVRVAMKADLSKPLHSPHEYMPALKSALKLGPLATHAECADQLARVRDCCMKVGVDGMHDGERMSDYTGPLRTMVAAAPGMTAEELFETVEDLIGHAIDQHVAEMHPGGAQMNDDPAGDGAGDMTMAMTAEETKRLKDLETEVSTLTTKCSTAETRASTAESRVAEVEGKLKMSAVVVTLKDAAETPAAAIAREFKLELKDGETVGHAIGRVLEQNAKLLKDKADREEADTRADVETAFETYKDSMKLSEDKKPAMLSLARSDRASFFVMYPPIAPGQAHLLRDLMPANPRPEAEPEIVVPGFTETVRKLQVEQKLSLSDAQIEATSIVNAAVRRKAAADAKKDGK